MITTIAAIMIGTACTTTEPVQFKHAFKKDEVASYQVRVSGEFENEGDVRVDIDIDVTTKDVVKDGANYSVKINKAVVQILGEDMPIGDLSTMSIDLKSNGVPKQLGMNAGPLALVNIAILTRMLPDKELEIAQTFTFSEKSEGFEYSGTGSYLEDRTINEKVYAILQTNGVLKPADEEQGALKVTLLLDKATGKIYTTEAKIELPNGELNLKMGQKQ